MNEIIGFRLKKEEKNHEPNASISCKEQKLIFFAVIKNGFENDPFQCLLNVQRREAHFLFANGMFVQWHRNKKYRFEVKARVKRRKSENECCMESI